MSNFAPTPYDDVNAILAELLTAVTRILGNQFIGLYLHGSLAAGDFHPHRSDIDFVVVTATELANETTADLAALHAQIRATGSYWANQLEGDYIPLAALGRYDPAKTHYPHLSTSGHFAVESHDSGVIILQHILREKGVVVAGPPIRPLIGPVTPDELRQATLAILYRWWKPKLIDPAILADDAYQVYAVLTICRMLYTLKLGDVVSKPVGAQWALDVVDGRFIPLIQQADAWQNGIPFNKLAETLDFIGYALAQSARYGSVEDESSTYAKSYMLR